MVRHDRRMTTTHLSQGAYLVPSGEGSHHHFLNHLATVKVAPGDTGAVSVVEFVAPRGFGAPEHRHDTEDEVFIVLEGELRFRTGDAEATGASGSVTYLPRRRSHTFQVLSDTARFIVVNASATADAPRFAEMVIALGAPTDEPSIPEPVYIDPARVAEICAAHGVDIVGPPPAPLPTDGP